MNLGLGHDLNLEHDANSEHIANLEHITGLEHNVSIEHNVNLEENPIENLEEQKLQQESEHQPKEHEDEAVVGGSENKWPGESVFRGLVPAQKVDSIIGRKGEFIKKIVEETRARIKILDGPLGTTERIGLEASLKPWFPQPKLHEMNHPPNHQSDVCGLLKAHP